MVVHHLDVLEEWKVCEGWFSAFNRRVAAFVTRHVGTMVSAYVFSLLAIVGLLGLLHAIPPVWFLLIGWFSTTYLQLVLLPVIMVGQNQAQEASDVAAIAEIAGRDMELANLVAAYLKSKEATVAPAEATVAPAEATVS